MDEIEVYDEIPEETTGEYTYQEIEQTQEMTAVQLTQQEYMTASIALQKMTVGMISVVCGLIAALIIAVIWNGSRHK